MEIMVVRTQAEYDKAEKAYQTILDENYFDLDAGKGNEIVEEVDCHLHNYKAQVSGGAETEAALSRYYFTPAQAKEIMEYFDGHYPRDLYDIEKGLNSLNLHPERLLNITNSLIEIRDPDETIIVTFPVSVYGTSVVEATGFAVLHAYDEARVFAHDNTRVYAFNEVKATACENSFVSVHHNATCDYNDDATGVGNSRTVLFAYDNSRITLLGKSRAMLWNNTLAYSFNDTQVTAFEKASIEARDKSIVLAQDSVDVEAKNNAIVIAKDKTQIKGRGDSLIFTQGNEVTCNVLDNSRRIDSEQNKPENLEKNVLEILDHPGIGRNPFSAVSILLKAVPDEEKELFSRELRKLGCMGKEATDKYFLSLKGKNTYFRSLRKDPEYQWER